MHHSNLLVSTTLALLASTASAKIDWAPCNSTEFNTTVVPLECASLDVPFDYTNPNNETLSLDLIKVPAPLGSKGSILMNPGGPGGLGRSSAAGAVGPTLIPLTGGEYDIVSWDTRGTGQTIQFECSDDPIERWEIFRGMVSANGSESDIGTLWARAQIDAETCAADPYGSKVGAVMTTAFVARDMMQIVDALEEDGLLRYWGISYGTTLGATVASMFPERMDKVLLDGVQNPHEYYHAHANFEEWTDTDAAFADMFAHCIKAGPELCVLAAHNKTGPELEALTWDLLTEVKTNPIPIGNVLVDYSGLKGLIQSTLYTMQSWNGLMIALDYLIFGEGDLEIISQIVLSSGTLSTLPTVREATRKTTQSLMGIYCGDNQVRTESFREFAPTIPKLYNVSSISGDGAVGNHMQCSQWKIEPKETYSGPIGAKTKTPMLFVGNTLDSHTPLKSAHNVSASFEDSVVLQVDGNGHGSVGVPSRCFMEKTVAFWNDGTLPEEGTVCERDIEPFTGEWWPEVFEKAGVDEEVLAYLGS